MVKNSSFTENFSREYTKLDRGFKVVVDKKINKILEKPELGKPLKHSLHGLRSERVGVFRLIYQVRGDFIIFHTLDHRKKVYK